MAKCNSCGEPVAMSAWKCQACGSQVANSAMIVPKVIITALLVGMVLWFVV